MPMLDASIPQGALSEAAERRLLATLTDILLRCEGVDPADPAARSVAWVFLHRPAAVFVAGQPAPEPRYRIVASVPEGQFTDERRAELVAAVTDAVLDAEAGAYPRDPMRVWVFPRRFRKGPGAPTVESSGWPISPGSRWVTWRRGGPTPSGCWPRGDGRRTARWAADGRSTAR